MPAIWNVSNGYNTNNNTNKKVSSKLTFEVGERFNGKIVGKGEGKDVTIKLADGWQFDAEIEGNVELLEKGNVRFEVEGYENGKLKLKLVAGDNTPNKGDNFSNIINKEGLTKKDELLLKQMIKFNIPLTKENINELKGLIQFNQKINSNEEEVTKFIKNYLLGKNISGDSSKGQNITNVLKDFLSEFKTLGKEDILFFKENNIEFTEEGIKSYNKLYKEGEEPITKLFEKIKGELEESVVTKDKIVPNELDKGKGNLESSMQKAPLESKDIKTKEGGTLPNENQEPSIIEKEKGNLQNTGVKAYEGKERISMLDVLKTMVKEDGALKVNKLNSLGIKFENISSEDSLKLSNILKELGNDGIAKNFKELLTLNREVTKEDFEKVLTKLIGKDVTLTEKEFTQIKTLLLNEVEKTVKGNSESVKAPVNMSSEEIKQAINEVGEKIQNSSKEVVKENIKENINNLKDTIKEMISQSKLEGEAGEKIFNLIKNNLSSFKLMNSISSEYYYLDMPIKREEQEYPCKLIIKDNRKDGKKIDRNNVKMVVSIKTINLGTIDGYLNFRGTILDVELKCPKGMSKQVGLGKVNLENNLKELGFNVNINVSEKREEVTLTNCREFFGGKHKSMLDKMV